jgi:hypothetical protein
MTQPPITSMGSEPDIRVIKTLQNEFAKRRHDNEAAKKAIAEAELKLRTLKQEKEYTEKPLRDAEEALNNYAPDWEKRLTDDYWKNY